MDLPDAATLSALADIVGTRHVVTDPEVLAGSSIDWTGRFTGATTALVRPGSTDEVAGVVRLCRERGLAVTLQGGNTGLVGGSVPLSGELLVSLRRLDAVSIDERAGQATAGAGCTIGDLQRAAERCSWTYGVDLGSRDSATVGGTIGTNAGGLRMVRYGDTRAQVVGVEAVLGTGAVVSHLGGLLKDNTGYHLPGLLTGSEGTLGVVTAARLRLAVVPRFRATALLAFDGHEAAVEAALAMRRHLTSLEAVELFFAEGLELVCSVRALRPPFDRPYGAYLLVESAALADPTEEMVEALANVRGVADSAMATEPARRAELWEYRELHTEAVNSLGPPHKMDVTLPGRNLAAFAAEVGGRVRGVAPDARVFLWGHAADGNLHVNVVGVSPDDESVDETVYRSAVEAGGSISAEHGIGTVKRQWLHWCRSESEIAAFRAIKGALDPDRILNPNVLLP
jgi:FAD/FMN-containing dehydrogenase